VPVSRALGPCRVTFDYGVTPGSIPGRGAPPEGRAAGDQSPSIRQPDTPGTKAVHEGGGLGQSVGVRLPLSGLERGDR
jgi:hypothetical protein